MRSATLLLITLFIYCATGLSTELTAQEPEQVKGEYYGLKFDGRDSYVTLPHLNFTAWNTFTIEAWVKDWTGRICCEGKQGDPENSIWISIRASRHSAGWESNNGTNYSTRVDPNSVEGWDHVAMIYTGTEQVIYVNGKEVHRQNAPKPGPFVADRKFFLGAQEKWDEEQTRPAALFGKGIMRMFRVSNVVRYDKEFTPAQSFTPDANTELLLDFSKPDQTTLADVSKHKRNGTIHDAKWVLLTEE